MDVCLLIILLMAILIIFIEFKEGFNEGFIGTPEYRNEYNIVAKSNNPTDLLNNTKNCHEYCSSTIPDSENCKPSCDDISDDVIENIRMQTLIFGRYAPDDISIGSLKISQTN